MTEHPEGAPGGPTVEDEVDADHVRPDDVDDATVVAEGKVSEAFEWVERARGRLYDFHQMMGHADALMGDAADALAQAGHGDLAEQLRRTVVGRNVTPGMWTFQLVESFDDTYYGPSREMAHTIRQLLMGGKRHVYEAELKAARRQDGPTDDV